MRDSFSVMRAAPIFSNLLSKPEKLDGNMMFAKSFICISVIEQQLWIQRNFLQPIPQVIHCRFKIARSIFFQIHSLLRQRQPKSIIGEVFVISSDGLHIQENEININVDIFHSTQTCCISVVIFTFGKLLLDLQYQLSFHLLG